FFSFTDSAATEIHTLSLHDALPIWPWTRASPARRAHDRRVRGKRRRRSRARRRGSLLPLAERAGATVNELALAAFAAAYDAHVTDRKSTRLNSSHVSISYAVFCLKK